MNKRRLVIADADALVAFANVQDANHKHARVISEYLAAEQIAVVFPITAICEAVTVLQRKLTKPELAERIRVHVVTGVIATHLITSVELEIALDLFGPFGSKQNTLFDALIAAVAKEQHADAIFSFDGWFSKRGFVLASQLMEEGA